MMEKKKTKKGWYMLFAFLTTIAFCINLGNYNSTETIFVKKLQQILTGGNTLQWLLIISALFLFYNHAFSTVNLTKKADNTIKVIAMVFSAFSYIGIMCENFEDWQIGKFMLMISILLILGYFFALYAGIKLIFYYCFEQEIKEKKRGKWTEFLLEKHIVAASIVVCCIGWLPFMICYYPGIANWDGMRSLTCWFGKIEWGNHHPVLISVIMGLCMELGQKILDDNMGIFVYSLFQTIVSFLTFANILHFLKKVKAPYILRGITIIYFAVMPFWQVVGYSLLKDPLYCMILTNLTILLAEMIFDVKDYATSNKKWIYMTALALLCCFTRNNGVYVMLVLFASLLLWVRKKEITRVQKGKVVVPVLTSVIVFFCCTNIVYPKLSIDSDGMQESLSVLFQQTARYVSEYEGELTNEEKEILDATFQKSEEIGKVYNPELSDPVKNKLNKEITTEQFVDYLSLWFKQFWKHPGVYFEAFFYQTASYYAPDYTGELEGIGANYNMIILEGVNPDQYLNLYFQEKFDMARFVLKKWAYLIRHIPGIGLIYSAAFYQWLTILAMAAVVLYRNKEHGIIFIPSIVTMLVALLSPVNGSLRYYMPVMAMAPILLGIAWRKSEKTAHK